MTPAVALARISGSRQQREHGQSLTVDQPRIISQIAAGNGLEVVRLFEEVKSGRSNAARRVLRELLDYCIENGIHAVIVANFDRLTRAWRMEDSAELFGILRDNSIIVYTAGIVIDPNSPSADLTYSMLWSIARGESKSISSRVTASWDRGTIYRSPCPLGLVIEKDEGGKSRYVPDPYYAPAVRDAIRLTNDGLTTREIQRELQQRYPTMNWGVDHVRRLIEKPVYAGMIERAGQMSPATNVTPIVDYTEWKRASEILASRRRGPNRSAGGRALLGGHLQCDCGRSLTTLGSHGLLPPGKWGKFRNLYFYCNGRTDRAGGVCNGGAFRKLDLLTLLWKYRHAIFLEGLERRVIDESSIEIERLRRELDILDSKIESIGQQVSAGLIDPSLVGMLLGPTQTKRSEIVASIKAASDAVDVKSVIGSVDRLFDDPDMLRVQSKLAIGKVHVDLAGNPHSITLARGPILPVTLYG